MDTEPRVRTTKAQIQYYLKFCKAHPEINKRGIDKFDKMALKRRQSLWMQLAEHLNNIIGPSRSAKKWQETLSHWKCQVRSRLRKFTEKSSRQEIVCLDNVSIDTQDVTFEESAEFDVFEVTMENEEPSITTQQSSEFNEPQSEVGLNAIQSENEHTFDSVFYKRDDETDNDSMSSRLSTPSQASESAFLHSNIKKTRSKRSDKAKDVNLAAVCNTIIRSLEARKEREEILFMHQQNLMRKLDHSLTIMTGVLEKIDARLATK